ncbi:1-phosphofructokinase family hexose kinase [Wenjunlia tyrosinilytica]|uniref:1-phosphofructokinase family hexose kinase n=1 Tax=Wenjunlia tyrosinilytica TaxID=1544741 RepID=UPI001665D693|nr:1-phosphofructokinase family hexose kinase [Wenjunlia tyrosinilytica]
MPVLTVTLNTAVDVTYRLPRVELHGTNRVERTVVSPGGKGVNVARVLTALGHRCVVTGLAGGGTGEELRAMLAAPGPAGAAPLDDRLMTVAGTTRRTVAVVDGTGDATVFNEPGPRITADEWAAFVAAYRRLLGGCGAVALCGSLPPGAPADAYATLVREAHRARPGVPVLLDTSGEALVHGLAAGPDLVKPNADELAEATGIQDPAGAAARLAASGTTAVAASLGPDGALLVSPEGGWRAAPPRRFAGNPTGAGDSVVAGLLSGLVEGLSWPERLRRAVALSAATVLAPTAGEFDADAYRELLPRVRPEPIRLPHIQR